MRTFRIILFLLVASTCLAQRFPRPFDSVDQMVASNPSDPNTNAIAFGLHAAGDSPARLYQWIKSNSDAVTDDGILASTWPTAPTGRWFKRSIGGVATGTTTVITNTAVITVPNIAALKSLSVSNDIGFVNVKGYFTEGDKWGGQFYYDPLSVVSEDGGMVVAPNNGPGNWIRIVFTAFGGVQPGWFGGITNTTIDLAQAWLDANGSGALVIAPAGEYTITAPIDLHDNITLSMESGAVLTSDGTISNLVQIVGRTNVSIVDAALIGATNGIYIYASTNVHVTRVAIADVTTGILNIGNTTVRLEDNSFSNCTTNIHRASLTGEVEFDDHLLLPEIATPSTVAGSGSFYANTSDNHPHYKASTGTDYDLTSALPAGSDTQVQFNDGGVFGADSDFTWTKASNKLTLGQINVYNSTKRFLFSDSAGLLALGEDGLISNTTGINNSAIGNSTLKSNISGSDQTAVGTSALQNFSGSGTDNTAIGYSAGRQAQDGVYNTFVGSTAAYFSTNTSFNTIIGAGAGLSNRADGVTTVGYASLTQQTTGTANSALGYEAGFRVTTGAGNTLLGWSAGTNLTTGSSNVFIGPSSSGQAVATTKAIGIGAHTFVDDAGVAVGFGSQAAAGSTALGAYATNNNLGLAMISGMIITPKDAVGTGRFQRQAGVEVVLYGSELDMKSLGANVSYNPIVQPGSGHFYVDEVGLIVTQANTVTGQPSIHFTYQPGGSDLLAAVATTGLTAVADRQRFTTVLRTGGITGFTFEVSTAATGTTLKARPYIKGLLVEDQ